MKMLLPLAIGPALMLAACGGGGERPLDNAAEVADNAAATNYQAEVAALNDTQRHMVLIRAIRDANLDCQQVTESEQMAGEGLIYRARCGDGRDHIVAITPDGTAQIVSGGMGAIRP
jgi:hypothetical protein